ncbi:hypothetical protein SAMN05216302_103629 [Nitrosomonas aestuarii]|uniref:Uncharacterized protein n=1 Tax=Nitrosomonas aestuarii TaxID=52441 RepID=A0A1I4FGN1_9PROT|nr:hypothetical protein [Nitrosomonas aestuarii]SFL16087.1 hypothetical protein SAMN05216302_103629 [Nitrosomonas aestuarii]
MVGLDAYIIIIRAVARKLVRASWMMLKHQQPYDAKLMFPCKVWAAETNQKRGLVKPLP